MIEHPDIDRIQRFGYPSQEYLDFEQEEEHREEVSEDDETEYTDFANRSNEAGN